MTETRSLTVDEKVEELMHAGPTWLEEYRPKVRYLVVEEELSANGDLAPFRNLVTALCRMESSETRGDFGRTLAAVVEFLEHRKQRPLARPHAVEIWLKGRHMGEAQLLLRLLRKRFGELPDWVPTRLQEADPEELERCGDRLLDVDDLGAFFDIE